MGQELVYCLYIGILSYSKLILSRTVTGTFSSLYFYLVLPSHWPHYIQTSWRQLGRGERKMTVNLGLKGCKNSEVHLGSFLVLLLSISQIQIFLDLCQNVPMNHHSFIHHQILCHSSPNTPQASPFLHHRQGYWLSAQVLRGRPFISSA